jgi:hypothetical protein
MTIFRRNQNFHIGPPRGGKTLIARDASFKRALDQNPAATFMFAAMVKAEVEGHGRVYQFEVPDSTTTSAPKMTPKEFKAAYGNKPGVTFHCPDHLKHELEG